MYKAFGIVGLVIIFACSNSSKQPDSKALVMLGKQLFYDVNLSYNQTKSCATCHDPKFAFTDSYKRSIGLYGDLHQRNSKPLFNLQQQYYFTAADSTLHTLEQQMNKPLYTNHPPELGWYHRQTQLVQRLQQIEVYNTLYNNAYKQPIANMQLPQINTAIAAFILTIKSYSTAYDSYIGGNTNALTANEIAGLQLFTSSKTNCSQCHGGSNFNQPTVRDNNGNTLNYYNTGLYNIDGMGSYPTYDIGLLQLTNNAMDMGKYKVPTLRNLQYTAPYYHDGSEPTLTQVIANYNQGGRVIAKGINKGNGTTNKHKHLLIKPLYLTQLEQQQLVAFLYTLTDSTLVNNKEYAK